MNNPIVKICGLSTPEAIRVSLLGGATHLGFIFFQKSPRHVTPELAAALLVDVSEVERVAVTVNADDDYLDQIVDIMKPSVLQLHGNEGLERLKEIKNKYGLPIIKAFAVRDEDDLAKVKIYDGVADVLLLDAKPPKGADLPGGNGVSFEWSLVEQFQGNTPVLLSGGIDLQNVGKAMALVKGHQNSISGIDVSSGVESTPGVKDKLKIEAFLNACRLT